MRLLRHAWLMIGCGLVVLSCRGSDRGAQTTTTAGQSQPYSSPSYGNPSYGGSQPSVSGGSMSEGTSITSMMAAALVSYQSATMRITGARCDREVSCNQIGMNKRYSTRDVCERDQARKTKEDVKASDCPNGVDENRLQTCLSRISSQECSDLVTSLANIEACSPGTLCAK